MIKMEAKSGTAQNAGCGFLKEKTNSLCPVCYQEIPAQIYEEDGKVYISKLCREHGDFKFLLERESWIYKKIMNNDHSRQRGQFDNLMVPVTYSCNLDCPICYLPDRDKPAHSLEYIKKIVSNFPGGKIRLSGGEPTLREDLPQIIRFISQEGKCPVIITNGLKLADRNYVKELKKAGLKYVHFSFNGFNDKVYEKINGRRMLKIKLKALDNLKKEDMSVAISVMLVKGVNEGEIKNIYRFCLRNSRFINFLRIRAAVSLGRDGIVREQIYLSDIINMMSKIMSIPKEDLVEHSLSFSNDCHLACSLNIRLLPLFLRGLKVKERGNDLLTRIKIVLRMLLKVGLRTWLVWLVNKAKGKDLLSDFQIFMRVWPDKYRIDLDEIKRCPSSHLAGETGDIVPFCYGLIMHNMKISL